MVPQRSIAELRWLLVSKFHVSIAVFALCVDQLWTICGYTTFAFCDEQSIESVFEQGPACVAHRSWPGYREPEIRVLILCLPRPMNSSPVLSTYAGNQFRAFCGFCLVACQRLLAREVNFYVGLTGMSYIQCAMPCY